MKKILPILLFLFQCQLGLAQRTALHFDGVDDYILVAGNSKVSGPAKITCESWIYVTNFNSSPCGDCAPIIWQQDKAYRFGVGNTKAVHFQLLNGTTVVSLSSSSVLSSNTWHHIAGTFDGTKLKIYIDGVATDSTSATFSITYKSSATDVWIADPATGYGGTLEETRIWDYARSKAEIKEGMSRRYSASTTGLVLSFSYEDGIAYKNNSSVSKIDDAGSYSNDGAPKNFAMQDSASNFVLGRTYCDTVAYSKFSVSKCVSYQLPSKKRTVTKSGIYNDTMMSYRGCDSVMTINVSILKPTGSTQTFYSCDSLKSPYSANIYRKTGKYQEKLKNAVGCDSIISMNVYIIKKDTTYYSYNGCDMVVLKNGKKVIKSGIYIDSFKNYRGCDSFIFHLAKVRNRTFAKMNLKVCRFVICPSNSNKVFRSAGIYFDTLINFLGCDSIIEYTVTSKSTYGTVNISSCSNFKSPSKKYTWTKSGTYFDTLVNKNSAGCDSFMTINLTLNPPKTDNMVVSGCRFYVCPSGKIIEQTSIVNDTLKFKAGCDSVIYTLNVTIYKVNKDVSRSMNTLVAQTNNGSAQFQWLDCKQNYSVITGETNKQFTPATNGEYAVAVTENTCKDTSSCVLFEINGNKVLHFSQLIVQPNPSRGSFNIQSVNILNRVEISLIDLQGKVQKVWNFEKLKKEQLEVKLLSGVYYLKVVAAEGQNTWPIVIE